MSFEAESNSELTVLVPAYQLHFRFLVQNKIHKQQILSDTRTGILGSIAGPCDFLPAVFAKHIQLHYCILIWPWFCSLQNSRTHRPWKLLTRYAQWRRVKWSMLLGSIAGPCDFLPARSDEFQKVCTSIIIFPPPSLPPTLCILHFTLRHCAYLVKSFHGLCVLEFCREQNHGHIRIQYYINHCIFIV
jgi:hypothetical protein